MGLCGRLLLLFLLLVPGASHAAQRGPGRILPDADGPGAVILRSDGTIEHIDMTTGEATPLRAAGAGPLPSSIARPGKGSVVYAIVPAQDGRTTTLAAHDVSGEAGPTLEVKGRGSLLEVTEDGRFACIAGTKAGSKDEGADRWILTVVDIATGETAAPIPIGFVPLSMALRGRDGILARLFVAGEGRVATYSMVPARPSWFYRSPGANHGIALPSGGAVVCLLREDAFVVIDPQKWERDEGRVRSSTDDATTIVPLGQPGGSIAMSPDGRYATVLAQDGRSIALIDIDAGRVDRTLDLPQPADLSARVMVASRLLLASRETGTRPTWLDVPMPAAPEPTEIAAVEDPPPPRSANPTAAPETIQQEEAATPSDTGAAPREVAEPPPQAFPPAPTATATVASEKPAEQTSAPAESKKPAESPAQPGPAAQQPKEEPAPQQAQSPDPAPESPPAGNQGSPPSESPSTAPETPPTDNQEQQPAVAAQEPFLSGHVRGTIPAGLQVLLYGPDNVLRLGARAPVASDGVWRLPLPAPGRYRVVVSAGSASHVFSSPEFRTIVITGSGSAMTDLDFEIRGSL